MVAPLHDTLGEEFFRKHFQELQDALNARSAEQAALFAAVQLQQEKYARQEELLHSIAERLRSGDSCVLQPHGSRCSVGFKRFKPNAGDTDLSGEDVELMDEECNESKAICDEVYTETRTPPQIIGTWMDPHGSFFSGHLISICSDKTWRPENPRLPGQKTATYTLEPISEVAVKLIETRLDMSQHVFIAEINDDCDALDITMPKNSSLRWSLVKTNESGAACLRLAARLEKGDGDETASIALGAASFKSLNPSTTAARKLCLSVHKLSKWCIKRKEFDLFIGIAIALNSICMGAQLEYTLGPQRQSGMPTEVDGPFVFTILEHVFLTIYVFEIMINLSARGCKKCFTDHWFIFDFGLVITGAASQWVIDLARLTSTSGRSAFEQILILRLLRLLRLMRAVRGIRRLQTPWRLIAGMFASTGTMVWTMSLLLLILYCFACIGVEIITKDEALWIGEPVLMENSYKSLFRLMCSLVQFASLDSVAALYLPLIKLKPVLILFFLPIFMTVSIVLMNLVTAVILESALDRALNDKHFARMNAKRHISKLRPIITEFFHKVDKHERGTIQIEDLMDFSLDDLPEEIRSSIKVETMQDLFWILDVSSAGHVSEVEFVEGMMNFSLDYRGKASLETVLLLKVLKAVNLNASAINNSMARFTTVTNPTRRSISTPAFGDQGGGNTPSIMQL